MLTQQFILSRSAVAQAWKTLYIIIYLSWYMFGCSRMGKSLRPRHFLDEFRPISGFQKGLLTRKTSHRQPRKFLLYSTERRVAILEEWDKTLFIVQAQFLRFTRHCLSHCQKLKSVPILVSWMRLKEMCLFQLPPSRFRAFAPTEFTKARDVPAPCSKFDASWSQKDERATE